MVDADALQLPVFPAQEKSLIRIKTEGTDAHLT